MRFFDSAQSDDDLIAQLKQGDSFLDLSDQAFFLRICKAAILRGEVDLLQSPLLSACSSDAKKALLDFARTAERPARYGYLEVLRKAGLSYRINQGMLNPKIAAYVNLVASTEEKNFSTLEEKEKFVERVQQIRGLCNGWSFVEYTLSAKNLGAHFDLWLEAAKFELLSWDGQQTSLAEVLDLPQSAPMTRGELFERIVGMILAYQGDYYLGGDAPVTQAALRGELSAGFGGMELSLQGKITFLNQTVACFTSFGSKGFERLLQNARFVEVIENGVLTFAANNHVIYLAAYRNQKGELCYQLFDANSSAGRLSTKRLSLVAASIPDMLRVSAKTPGVELNGFVSDEIRRAAVQIVTVEQAAALRSCTAAENFKPESLRLAVVNHPVEWFLSMLPCFRDVYKRVVNTVMPIANSYGSSDEMSILAALIRWKKAELIPVFLSELQADANLKAAYKGQAAIFYALEVKNVGAVAALLFATTQENINNAVNWLPAESAAWIFDVLLPGLKEKLALPIQGFDEKEDAEANVCHPDILSLITALRASRDFGTDSRLSDYPADDTVMRCSI